jgi:hypothetical protein
MVALLKSYKCLMVQELHMADSNSSVSVLWGSVYGDGVHPLIIYFLDKAWSHLNSHINIYTSRYCSSDNPTTHMQGVFAYYYNWHMVCYQCNKNCFFPSFFITIKSKDNYINSHTHSSKPKWWDEILIYPPILSVRWCNCPFIKQFIKMPYATFSWLNY